MVTTAPKLCPAGQAVLPTIPFRQPDILEAPPQARELQAEGPVSRVLTPAGDEAWLVTGYNEIRQIYSDDRFGVSHRDPAHAPRLGASKLIGGPGGNFETEHTDRARVRSYLAPFFSVKRMRVFRPRVELLVEEAFRDIEAQGPPADLHEGLAVRLPVSAICELLAVPPADRAQFREWTQGVAHSGDKERSGQSFGELLSYTGQLVARRRAKPGDDVISGLCAADDGALSDRYISFLAAMLLFAGHETTVARLDYGVLLMMAHPEQRQLLMGKTDRLSDAVEEILRAVVHGGARETIRYAREDVAVGGITIRSGDLVVLYSAAANRDRGFFPGPEGFDVCRAQRPHLTFGYGPHYCLGAPLVRIELETVFSRIFQRFPGLRLEVPTQQLEARRDVLTGGLSALPVTWDGI
jgi:pentalenolactone synthase